MQAFFPSKENSCSFVSNSGSSVFPEQRLPTCYPKRIIDQAGSSLDPVNMVQQEQVFQPQALQLRIL